MVKQKRVRKTPEERMGEITRAAAKLISERGFNGISLKDVADRKSTRLNSSHTSKARMPSSA